MVQVVLRLAYLPYILPLLQLRGNQKDFNFEVPVVVNLKHIYEFFGLYPTCFLIQKLLELIRLSSDGQYWRKGQNKKGGKFELRWQLCYYNCQRIFFFKNVLQKTSKVQDIQIVSPALKNSWNIRPWRPAKDLINFDVTQGCKVCVYYLAFIYQIN